MKDRAGRVVRRKWLLAAACLGALPVWGAEGTWKGGEGFWFDSKAWIGDVPQNAGDSAIFGPTSASSFVTLTNPFTLGSLSIDSAQSYLFFSSTAVITFDNAGQNAHLLVSSGSHTVYPPVMLVSDLDAAVDGSAVFTFFRPVSAAGALSKSGTGTLVLGGNNATWTGDAQVNGGVLRLSYVPASSETTYQGVGSGGIFVGAGGTLDLDKAARTSTYKGALTSAITFSGSGAAGLGSVYLGKSADVVLSGALITAGGSLRSDATNLTTIGFAIGDPVSGAGSLGGTGGLTLIGGGAGKGLATFQLNVKSTHSGGTVIDGARLVISSKGSLVGTGDVVIKPNGELDLLRVAGDDPAVSEVSPHSVVLAGGALSIGVTKDVMSYLSANSGEGQVLLLPGIYNGSLDFSGLAGTPRVGAAAASTGSVTTIAAGVVLRPDSAGHTVRLGGQGSLVVNPVIEDVNGVATNLEVTQGLDGKVTLKGANTFSGTATFNAGRALISNGSALGTGSGGDADGTTIGPGVEVDFDPGVVIGNEKIHLNGGTLSLAATSVLNGPIVVGADSKILGGQELGPISGPGGIVMGATNATQILAGDNTYTGLTRITKGQVQANSPTALGATSTGTSVETGAELFLNSSSSEPITVNSATLHLGGASVYSGQVLLTGNGQILPDAGHVFNGSLEIQSGTVRGSFSGAGSILKTGTGTALLDNSSGTFDGPIEIREGILSMPLSSLGTTNHATIVSGTGILEIRTGASSEPIFLQNANGLGQGGLSLNTAAAELDGPLDLGNVGSTIGFVPAVSGTFTMKGPISGGSLTLKSASTSATSFVLAGSANTYTGQTYIDTKATLMIADGGGLTKTSRIFIAPEGKLALGASAMPDRIASVPIQLQGGTIEAQTSPARVGDVMADSALGKIVISGSSSASIGSLTLGSLTHQRGAFVQFSAMAGTQDVSPNLGSGAIGGEIHFDRAPQLVNGMIGGWAVLPNGTFATYGEHGIVPLVGSTNDISTASATDNVEFNSTFGLTASKTINSIRLSGGFVPMGEQVVLTVNSGGIIVKAGQSSSISGGKIVPGADADGQLFMMGDLYLLSTVADAPGQPTTLVANGIHIQSSNTHTGGTFFSGKNTLETPTGLPVGGDVTVANGTLAISVTNATTIRMGKLTLIDPSQNNGRKDLDSTGSAQAMINADSYDLRSGLVFVPLAGNGTMVKSGVGTVTLALNNNQYTGLIDIQEGKIDTLYGTSYVTGATGYGPIRIGPRGVLMAGTMNNPLVILDGGRFLGGNFSGELHVTADSIADRMPFGGKLTIDAGATLQVTSSLVAVDARIDGALVPEGITTLEVDALQNQSLTGTGIIAGRVVITTNGKLVQENKGGKSLTINGNLSFSDNGKMQTALPASGNLAPVSVNGNVDLSSAMDQLVLSGGHAGRQFDLLSYTGTLTGTFNKVSPWYSVNYDAVDKLVSVTVVAIPGDANDDHLVDFRDFQVIEAHFGETGGWAQGDFDGNGLIDRADLGLFFKNYLQEVVGAEAIGLNAVPEPGGMTALLGAVGAMLRRSRSRRGRCL